MSLGTLPMGSKLWLTWVQLVLGVSKIRHQERDQVGWHLDGGRERGGLEVVVWVLHNLLRVHVGNGDQICSGETTSSLLIGAIWERYLSNESLRWSWKCRTTSEAVARLLWWTYTLWGHRLMIRERALPAAKGYSISPVVSGYWLPSREHGVVKTTSSL